MDKSNGYTRWRDPIRQSRTSSLRSSARVAATRPVHPLTSPLLGRFRSVPSRLVLSIRGGRQVLVTLRGLEGDDVRLDGWQRRGLVTLLVSGAFRSHNQGRTDSSRDQLGLVDRGQEAADVVVVGESRGGDCAQERPERKVDRGRSRQSFVLAVDLGQDRIYVYRFDANSRKPTLSEGTSFVSFAMGDGPRHFVFHPNGRWIYALAEESSAVAFLHYDAMQGTLALQQTISCLPAGFAGTNFTSEVVISPDGRFLYAANRLHDTIAICSIGSSGELKLLGEVSTIGTIRGIAHSIRAANSSMCAISAATTSPVSGRIARTDCFRLRGSTRRLGRRRS
jgi:hypothetical protein